MITNFLRPEERKNIIKIKIPEPPPYLDKTLVFCFLLCLCALIAVLRQGEILASLILLMILTANVLISLARFTLARKVRKHYKNLKIIHEIYNTPTMVEKEDYVEFIFITPSENLIREIQIAHDKLIKELE